MSLSDIASELWLRPAFAATDLWHVECALELLDKNLARISNGAADGSQDLYTPMPIQALCWEIADTCPDIMARLRARHGFDPSGSDMYFEYRYKGPPASLRRSARGGPRAISKSAMNGKKGKPRRVKFI